MKNEDVRQFSDIPFQIAGTHENNLQEIDHPKEFEQYIEFVFFCILSLKVCLLSLIPIHFSWMRLHRRGSNLHLFIGLHLLKTDKKRWNSSDALFILFVITQLQHYWTNECQFNACVCFSLNWLIHDFFLILATLELYSSWKWQLETFSIETKWKSNDFVERMIFTMQQIYNRTKMHTNKEKTAKKWTIA